MASVAALDDVRAVVTGGSQGIGLGIARQLVIAGARVTLAGRVAERLDAARADLAAEGLDVEVQVADISTREGCRQLVAAAVDRWGGLDVLCANAGIYPEVRLGELTEAHVDEVLNTNLKGTLFLVDAAVPALRASGRGRVIVTSSITGPVTGYPGLSVYAASKSAQLGFVRTAAVELARDGITVNAISPGAIRTEGLAGLGSEAVSEMVRAIPVGRLGSPDDIGAAAAYLAGSGASFVTGQQIIVDGGQTLPEFQDLV